MPRGRKRKTPTQAEKEEAALADGSTRGRGPEWWSNYGDAELKEMQARGRALVEGGLAAIPPDKYGSWG